MLECVPLCLVPWRSGFYIGVTRCVDVPGMSAVQCPCIDQEG